MPACTTESLTKLWNNNHREYVKASLENSDSNSPHSHPSSPLSTSPKGTLRRSRSATPTSTEFFQDHFVIKSEWRTSRNNQPPKENKSLLVRIIGWYPFFLLQVLRASIAIFLPVACIRIIIGLPSLLISIWLYILWKVFDFPLLTLKWVLSVLYPCLSMSRKKRTVLISGGSTIQALHLARNFYSAGARVVVCEVNGLFSLARFSTAVSKFYTLPKPTPENQRAYIRALCEIVEREGAIYYVPVNVASSAIYDAAAKPVLELLGCNCFCPSGKDVLIFDDILEVFHRCVDGGIPTPPYFLINSTSKLALLYQNGTLRANKYIMSKCGPFGTSEKYKIVLPPNLYELRVPGEINENNPWVIVENQDGNVFVTCTTVKQNQVVANVTCQLDEDKSLKPIVHKEIEEWLCNFFSKMNLTKPVSGHFTFSFVITEGNNMIFPLSCKVGVSLPYICYTSVHPKILLKPCKHFSRQNSGPLTTNKGRYWMHRALLDAVQKPSVDSVTRLIDTVLDKREVLFVYWDPLPYFAYYHMQLPLRNISEFLHRRRLPNIATLPVQ